MSKKESKAQMFFTHLGLEPRAITFSKRQRVAAEKFSPAFFKRRRSQGRGALVAPRKARNNLRHFLLLAFLLCLVYQKKSEKRLKIALCRKVFSTFKPSKLIIRFFLWYQRRKEKSLAKKKTPWICFAPCEARPTLRALDGRSLFEKSDGKTFISFALIVANISTNQNLKLNTIYTSA